MILRLSALIFLAFLSTGGAAAQQTIESDITDVIVYSEGATVTRSATLQLGAGETVINFSGLPADINIENIQIEIANRAVRMGQVSFKTKQSRDIVDQEILSLESEIQALTTKLSILEDSSKVAKLQLKFLESLANGYAKEAWVNAAQANADIGSWQQALNLMQSGSVNAFSNIRENQLKTVEIEKDLDLLKRSLEETRQGTKTSKSVTVSLQANVDVSSVVKLHYYQTAATWYPIYEARLNSDSGELSLIQKAVIQQSTHETWDNVKVTLSTSQPSADLAAPHVESMFLSLQPQYQSRGSYGGGSTLEEIVVTASKSSRGRRSEKQDVELEGSRVNEQWSGSYALNFPIAGRITVTNRNSDLETYDLEKFVFPTKLVTQVVPRQSTQAFLGARFTNSEKLPLQGSKMTVFVDGVLIGSTQMQTILPGAEVTLPMGQDTRVEIIVSDQGGEGGKSGIISKHRTEVTDLVYEITNRRSAETTVEVKDVYPVSRDKAIKILVDKKATKPDEDSVDDKAGVVMWRKTLGASESWKINQSYKVSYPAKLDLSNR